MQRILQLAADGATVSDPAQLLLVYGPLGIFAALLVMFVKGAVAREREKSDQAEKQVQELNEFIRGELLPKQVEATLLHKQVAEVLGQAVQLISELKMRDSLRREDPPHGGMRG